MANKSFGEYIGEGLGGKYAKDPRFKNDSWHEIKNTSTGQNVGSVYKHNGRWYHLHPRNPHDLGTHHKSKVAAVKDFAKTHGHDHKQLTVEGYEGERLIYQGKAKRPVGEITKNKGRYYHYHYDENEYGHVPHKTAKDALKDFADGWDYDHKQLRLEGVQQEGLLSYSHEDQARKAARKKRYASYAAALAKMGRNAPTSALKHVTNTLRAESTLPRSKDPNVSLSSYGKAWRQPDGSWSGIHYASGRTTAGHKSAAWAHDKLASFEHETNWKPAEKERIAKQGNPDGSGRRYSKSARPLGSAQGIWKEAADPKTVAKIQAHEVAAKQGGPKAAAHRAAAKQLRRKAGLVVAESFRRPTDAEHSKASEHMRKLRNHADLHMTGIGVHKKTGAIHYSVMPKSGHGSGSEHKVHVAETHVFKHGPGGEVYPVLKQDPAKVDAKGWAEREKASRARQDARIAKMLTKRKKMT